jgi:hypothetical protein
MNKIDKQKFDDLSKVYDDSANILKELASEVTDISVKYGTSSLLTKRKKNQLEIFIKLYDKTLDYINYLRDLNHSMYNELLYSELTTVEEKTGLPTHKILHLSGASEAQCNHVKKISDLISRVKAEMDYTENTAQELQTLVNKLKAN